MATLPQHPPVLDTDAPAPPPTVAIVGGSGELGLALAIRLGACGVPVVIGSRSGERAEEAAATARAHVGDGRFAGAENATAAAQAEIVFVAVPFASQAATLKALRPRLRAGQLVVDCTVPLAPAVGGRPTRTLGVWQGSAAQQAAELVPEGVGVVSAFHTVSASALASLELPLSEDVLICGDSRADKQRLSALVERIEGLRPVDAGRLEQSRIVESLTALLIGLNGRYKTHAGIRITGLPSLWGAPAGT